MEIKPKQGWVPFSERHFPKCAFCMNQYVKVTFVAFTVPPELVLLIFSTTRDKYSRCLRTAPVIFSQGKFYPPVVITCLINVKVCREPTKMIRAVQALVANPQNNLKIFKNGQLQYSEDCEVGLFASFLTDIFRNNVETFEK